jgi:hypothetical protein
MSVALLWTLSLLRGVPNCLDNDAIALNFIEDDVRSSPDDQFSDSGAHASSAQVWMISKGLNNGNDAGCEPFRGAGLI